MPPPTKKTGVADVGTPIGQLLTLPAPPYPQPVPKHFPNPTILQPRRRVELVSTGIDEALQNLGGDPYGGTSWAGLRVPAFVTVGPAHRYLFQLCSFSVAEAVNVWVRGYRHGYTLGVRQSGPRVIEQWVTDPFFKMANGNVSWHLRLLGPNEPPLVTPGAGPVQPPDRSFPFQNSDTPGLLYQTATVAAGGFYTALTAYTPPYGGKPLGVPLTGGLGTFFDLKTDWRDAQNWQSLDIHIEGPAKVVFYASVQQSDTQTSHKVTTPLTFFTEGLSSEEQFLLNFPTANIWRVAGAMIVEIDDQRE